MYQLIAPCGPDVRIWNIQRNISSGGSRISHRGGRAPIRGGVDLRRRCFSVKMYAKMKELGPVGEGVRPARPPRSANNKQV